jgi:hypothetical protein
MFNLLKKVLESIKTPPMSDLETYLVSKKPQSSGDLDYWIERYELEKQQRAFSAII